MSQSAYVDTNNDNPSVLFGMKPFIDELRRRRKVKPNKSAEEVFRDSPLLQSKFKQMTPEQQAIAYNRYITHGHGNYYESSMYDPFRPALQQDYDFMQSIETGDANGYLNGKLAQAAANGLLNSTPGIALRTVIYPFKHKKDRAVSITDDLDRSMKLGGYESGSRKLVAQPMTDTQRASLTGMEILTSAVSSGLHPTLITQRSAAAMSPRMATWIAKHPHLAKFILGPAKVKDPVRRLRAAVRARKVSPFVWPTIGVAGEGLNLASNYLDSDLHTVPTLEHQVENTKRLRGYYAQPTTSADESTNRWNSSDTGWTTAATLGGGALGAALDDENRLRGGLIGALLAGGSTALYRRFRNNAV